MKTALTISLAYLLAGSAWILLSDSLLLMVFKDQKVYIAGQILKGWVFVFFSTGLIYLLIRRRMEKIQDAASARKKAEEQVRKSEERLNLALDAVNDGVWDWRVDTGEVFFNSRWYNILGYEHRELPETFETWERLLHPDDLLHAKQIVYKHLETGTPFELEFRMRTKDGLWKWILARGKAVERDASGRAVRMLGTHMDITERKQAVNALRESERKLKNLFENSPVGIFQTTSRGTFKNMNAELARLLGAESTQEAIWKYADLKTDLYVDTQRRQDLLDLLKKRGNVVGFEFEAWRLDGRSIWLSLNAMRHGIQSDGSFLIDGFATDVTERKQRQIEFESIFNLSLDMISISDIKTSTFTKVNPAFINTLGYTEEELLTHPYTRFVHPDDLEPTRQIIEENLKKGIKVIDFENRFRCKDGSYRYLRWIANPVPEIGKNFAIASDITDRKAAEKALQESEARYRAIFNAIPDLLFQYNNEGQFIGFHGREELLLMNPREFIGKKPEEILPAPVAVETRKALNHILSTGEYFDYEYSLEIYGEQHFFEARMFRVDPDSILAMVRDITDRKRSEEQILRLSGAVTHAAGAVILVSKDRVIEYVNPAYEAVSGLTASEVIGKKSSILYQGLPAEKQEQVHEEIWETVSRGQVWKGRLDNRTRSGIPFVVEATTSPIMNEQGEIDSVVIFWRDITNEDELQRQLIQTQKMEAIGTLAGGIAHDFNNILGSIIGFSELAHLKAEGNDELKQDLEMVLMSADRAKDLVRQILTFSRKEDNQKKTMQLVPLLKEIVKMLRATIPTTIQISLNTDTESDWILIDPVQMHQVVTNICSNATYAMPDGGEIDIQVREALVTSDEVELEPGEYIELRITDTGSGMTKEVLERAFDPFFTTKKPGEGTGMGLPVVHGIVSNHHGHISVHSEPGEGTTFTVLLPMVDREIEEEKKRAERKEHTTGKERIFFVDDEESLIRLAEFMLQDLGYSVETSLDSRSALERIRLNPETFDLVITDQTMPHLTGLDFAREVQKIRKNLPVLLCSGNLGRIDEQTLSQAGIAGFIQKPYKKDQIAAAIRESLSCRN